MKIIDAYDDLDTAMKKEVYWIRYFKKKGCKLTNINLGGDGVRGQNITEEGKAMHSKKMKEYFNNNPDKRYFIRDWTIKNGHPRLGIKCSDYTKSKISEANKGRIQTKKEIVNRVTKIKKPVYCPELNISFLSSKDAERYLGLGNDSVGKVARGKRKQIKGYTFNFIIKRK